MGYYTDETMEDRKDERLEQLEAAGERLEKMLAANMAAPDDDVGADAPPMQFRPELQPCGHPREAIRSSPYIGEQHSNWCGWCEDVDAKLQELERMRRSISFIAAQLRDLLDPPAIQEAE